MTENNSDPNNPNSDPNKPWPDQPAEAKPKKKKRRWILKIAIGLVGLIILLVLLAPTILSTGMVRDMVVNSINSSALNGKLQIKDWSFGWTSGVHIVGVTLDDANSVHLLSVADISTPISFLKAATGNIDLGDVTIKDVDFNAQIDSKGELNFLKAIKPSNKPPSNEPAKLPNVSGTIHLQNVTGTFQDDVNHISGALPPDAPLNVTATIKDINQPITDTIDLGLQLGQKKLVKVKVDGSVSAIQNNLVAIDKLAADQTITLSEGDLAAVTQVLHALHLDIDVAGKMNGKIVAKVETLDKISADVGISLADLSAGGKQLAGDTVALKNCDVNVKASVVSSGGKNAQIKLDMPISMTPKGASDTNHVMVHADVAQDSLMGTADVFKAIAAHLAKTPATKGNQIVAITGSGNIKITADVNVANLVNQAPNLLHLEKGTSLTSGTLSHETTITIANGQAVIATDTKLKDFAGSSNGTPVHVNDIDATAGLTAVGGAQPDLHDIKLGLSSAFADVKGGGATLGKLSFQGTSDLKNLQQQISQIIDLDAMLHAPAGSHVSLAGTVSFDAHTDGDLTADNSNIDIGASLTAKDLNVNIPGQRPINEPNLVATYGSNVHHTSVTFIESIDNVKITVNSPAINFVMAADVKMGGKFGVSVPSFEISQGTIDARLAQEEFGGALALFVPKPAEGQQPTLIQKIANDSVRVASGTITISGQGKFDQSGFGFQKPLQIQLQPTDLTITDDLGTAQTVHVPAASLTVVGNGNVDDQKVATVKNLTISAMLGSGNSPLFDLELGVDASAPLSGQGMVSASRIQLSKLYGDLPAAQSTLAPLLPLLSSAAPSAQPSLVQQLATGALVCTSGKLSGSMLASYDGTTLTISQPLTISIDGLTLQQKATNATPINNQTIQAVVGGSVSTADGGIQSTLHQLQLQVGDQLKVQTDPQAPLVAGINRAGVISANGSIQLVNADIPKLLGAAGLVLPPDQVASLNQLTSGAVSGSVKIQNASAGNTVTADISVNSLTVTNLLNNETAHLLASATLASDMSAIHDVNVGVDTSFAKKVSITNGQIILATKQGDKLVPVGLFDQLRSITVEADEADLAKLDGLANIFFNKAVTPGPGEKNIAVVPPPQITSGTATLKLDVSRSGNTTTANISQVLVHGLAIKSNGNTTTWPNDLTANLTAAVETRPDATGNMPLKDQLIQASVTALALNSGIGTTVALTENKPIIINSLDNPANMLVQGGVDVDADIAQAARIAETFGGAKPNSYPYAGHLHLSEPFQKDPSQSRLHITGGGNITKFTVMSQPAPGSSPQLVFSEDNISIKNPLDFDFKTFSLIIDKGNPIAVNLSYTNAAGVSLSGTINDLLLKRQIADDNPVSVQLSYDLAKLWTIVKPMLSADQQKTFADLVISGKQSRLIKVTGSYPADKPYPEAVAMLQAGGYLTIDSLSTQGIALSNFDVPFVLRGGVLRTVYPDQPEDGNAPHMATCNGGTLNIGVARVDLKTDPMILSYPRVNQGQALDILKGVSSNPAMAKSILGKVLNNPAFSNASQAQGLVTVTINQLDKIPLSGLMLQDSPQNQGTASVVYSVTGLRLGSELLAVTGNDSVTADINNATVKFASGKVTEDSTMMIDRTKPLRFAGVVILSNEQFAPMTAYIPTALLGHLIPQNVQQYVPDQVTVPLKGDMNNPKLELDQTIAQLVKDAGKKALIGGLGNLLQPHH